MQRDVLRIDYWSQKTKLFKKLITEMHLKIGRKYILIFLKAELVIADKGQEKKSYISHRL